MSAKHQTPTDRALTVSEFCRAYKISTPHYYKLRALGRAPRELRLGAKVLITVEAEREWLEAQQNLSGEAAKAQAEIDERLRTSASNAGKRGGVR